MTDVEWRTCVDPTPMLEMLWDRKASDRKLRLYATACCRRLNCLVINEECRSALEVVDRFADGLATAAERSAARKAAQRAAQSRDVTPAPTAPKWHRRAASAVYYAAARDAWEAGWNARHLVLESLV